MSDIISPSDVANGSLDGQIVWVCDYRFNDFNNKPIRHVPPTKAIIVAAGSEKINYSNSYFMALNEHGAVKKSKKIKLYDATGWRSFPGIPLNIFTTEQACKDKYTELQNVIKKDLDAWWSRQTLRYNEILHTTL